jgi:hypothetical protein
MVEGVESVIVGEHDVGAVVQEQRQHVVPLLRDGVMQRRVSLAVLSQWPRNFAVTRNP